MKKLQLTALLSLIVIIIPYWVLAQTGEYYRYYNGELLTLEVVPNRYMIVYDVTVERADIAQIMAQDAEQLYHFEMSNKQYELFNAHTDQFKTMVRQQTGELHISPVFLNEDGREQFASNEILVELHEKDSEANIARIEQEYNLVRIDDESTRWLGDRIKLRLVPPYILSSFEIANALYESGLVRKANVNWVFNIEFHSVTPNDQYFGDQWNITQTMTDYAWNITTGSDDIIIAIVDEGVDLDHDDLSDNLLRDGSGNIIGINTTDTGPSNDPHPYGNDAHGTASAGVAAAVGNNSYGISGATWNSKIMPIQIARDELLDSGCPINCQWTYASWIVSGIEFAYQNGAHIISNSWGGTGHDQDIVDAFNDAASAGAIIIASAGNYYDWQNPIITRVRYPAALSSVIAVGATRENDVRKELDDGSGENWWGSAYGSGLDLVAPGINIPTTDNSGSSGYSSYDYIPNYGGTSASAPLVAGVTALMLSVNSNLTANQIRNILQNTADWKSHMNSNEYGHGRLNAYEAVKYALPNQLNSPFFAVWPSQDIGGSHIFGDSYLEFGTLIIPQGKAAVFSGTLTGFGGDYARILVQGNMVVESGTQLLDLSIEVAPTGRLIVRDGATIRPGSLGELVVEGYARLGSDVVVRRGDIEVAAGGTLIVGAGSTLNFNSGASLTSYGKVEIGSYAGADVILKRDPNVGGTWAGVHLNGAGADGSVFHRTRVEGAVNGISISNAGSVTLNHTRAEDNTWDGIRLINTATGWLEWVTATGNGRYGIYIDGGTPGNISSTLLADNINAGINIEGAGWIWDIQTSRIRDNASQGLWARDAAFLGINFSSIHDNANYNAASWSGAEIIAWDNWWGQAPPDPNGFHIMTGGTLNYSGWLSQDPIQGILSVSEGEALAAVQDPAGQKPRIPPKPEQVRTLSDLRAELFHTPASERLARVEELSGGMDPGWQPWAQVVGLEMLQQAGRHRDLVQAGGVVLAEAGLPAGVRRTIARRMFYSYLLGLQDAGQARAMIGLLEDLECEEAGSGQLSWLADFHGARFAESDEEPSLVLESGQSDLQVSNHPNPFNPVTTLRYTLPEAGEASLSVYNIQGQRVAALATGLHTQGTHTIGFDASRLASGVYLYRLTTSTGIVTGKMLLIK
jgi:hypothetical protein